MEKVSFWNFYFPLNTVVIVFQRGQAPVIRIAGIIGKRFFKQIFCFHGEFIKTFPTPADDVVFGILQGFLLCQRSEEHTSELQSLMRISYAVFVLKKKQNNLKQTR